MSEQDVREFVETVKVENSLETQGHKTTENKTTLETQNECKSEANANAPPLYNRRALPRAAETYELEKFEKKALLILNHKNFLNRSVRTGTEKDELRLRETFSQFGFEVEVENDLSHAQIMKKLNTYSSQDFTDYGCVAVAVLTHGAGEGLIRASDKAYNESDIIKHFKDVNLRPTLVTKPKIFIFQACRGMEDHTGVTVFPQRGPTGKDTDDVENEKPYTIPVEADMLVLHSSYKGKPSHRDIHNGSWFIQVLCHEIKSLARLRDLESILTRVKMVIATELSNEQINITTSEVEFNKQMPEITSTLMRLLYLRNFGEPAGPFDDAGDEADVVYKENRKSLRDSNHRNLEKQKGKSATKNKKWKYEHQMEFLQPYLQERTTKSNVENTDAISSEDNENSLPDLMATFPEPVISLQSTSSPTSFTSKNITAKKKKQTQSTQKLSVVGVLQNYLASRPATTTLTTMESGDPIQSFFKAMADSIKALPPDLQLKAKNKIYGIVSDLEYENLLRNSTSSSEEAAAETKKNSSQNNTYDKFLNPTASASVRNTQLLKPPLSTSHNIKKQLLMPIPISHTIPISSTSGINKQQLNIFQDMIVFKSQEE